MLHCCIQAGKLGGVNGVLHVRQAPESQDASQALALRGVRSAGRGADPKAIEDALWSLMLGYLDARLPGELCPSSRLLTCSDARK